MLTIEDRTEELMQDEYSPNTYVNIVEAIGEDALTKHKELIAEAFKNRDFYVLGRAIWNDVYDYWEKAATSVAECEEEQGLL